MTGTNARLLRWPTPRNEKPWTAHDLTRLRGCAAAKMSARQCAAKLGRTLGAVKYKAMEQGVRFHYIEQPRGVQRSKRQRRTLATLATRRHARARQKARRAAA